MPNNNCQLHIVNEFGLGYSMNSSGMYSSFAPSCACISKGDFSAIPGMTKMSIETYTDAYKAVSKLNLWDYLANMPEEDKKFGFGNSKEMDSILEAMELKNDHSGASFAITMWTMEDIAKKGWDAYINSYLKTDSCSSPPAPIKMDHNTDEDVWYVIKWSEESGETGMIKLWFETYEQAENAMKNFQQVDKNHNITTTTYWVDQVST